MSYYGLDEIDIYHIKKKLSRQDRFLKSNVIEDKLNGNITPLKDIVFFRISQSDPLLLRNSKTE